MSIENVKIKNFKSLRDINLNLENLTLVTGINSSGKSSFIQSILLIKQNLETIQLSEIHDLDNRKKPLSINGEYIQLGNKKDILYQDVYDENIEISMTSKKNESDEEFYPIKISFNSNTLHFEASDDFIFNSEAYSFNDDFQYIQTNRIEPNIFYSLGDQAILENNIGMSGEFTAHYLAVNRRELLKIDALRHKNSTTGHFLENVSLWMSDISENIVIQANIYDELQKVNLTYKYIYEDKTTNEYSPLNVGYGITYVLPIVVSILKAKEGDLIIIENPESHLHPKAQSKIAQLCAIAASQGVQIIIETHSDHIMNGIRIAIKERLLSPTDSKVFYFRKESNKLETIVDEICINNNGSIDKYPIGFFDQFDNDLDKLVEW